MPPIGRPALPLGPPGGRDHRVGAAVRAVTDRRGGSATTRFHADRDGIPHAARGYTAESGLPLFLDARHYARFSPCYLYGLRSAPPSQAATFPTLCFPSSSLRLTKSATCQLVLPASPVATTSLFSTPAPPIELSPSPETRALGRSSAPSPISPTSETSPSKPSHSRTSGCSTSTPTSASPPISSGNATPLPPTSTRRFAPIRIDPFAALR